MAHATSVDSSLLSGTGSAPARADGLFLRFHKEPVLNRLKSYGGTVVRPDGTEEVVQGAGYPVYDEVEYVEIRTPGDNTNIVDRPVRDQDRRQFPRQYADWKAGDEEQLTGMPLAHWPGVTRSEVETLKHFGVRTVEQLAAVSDGNLQNIGPIRALRQRAQDFLAAAANAAPIETLRSQLTQRENELDVLRRQVKELTESSRKKG